MSTQLFISWSGDLSHRVAAQLHEWIPTVLQSAEPFLSSTDIEKGSRWSDHVAKKLEECGFGIIVLTPSNLNAPWILFEAGALSKMVGRGQVSALLVGLDLVDVKLPLSQFQNTVFQKDDVLKLIQSINRAGSAPLRDEVLIRAFNALWPDFEKHIQKIITDTPAERPRSKARDGAPTDDLLSLKESVGELIQSVQSLRDDARRSGSFPADVQRSIIHDIERAVRIVPRGLKYDLSAVLGTLREKEDILGDDVTIDDATMTNMIKRLARITDWIEKRTSTTDYPADRARTGVLFGDRGQGEEENKAE